MPACPRPLAPKFRPLLAERLSLEPALQAFLVPLDLFDRPAHVPLHVLHSPLYRLLGLAADPIPVYALQLDLQTRHGSIQLLAGLSLHRLQVNGRQAFLDLP